MLPEKMISMPLGELCDFSQGVQIADKDTFKEKSEGLIRYLYIRDFFTDKFITYVENKYSDKIMNPDDIMMVNTGNTAGVVYRGKTGVLCNNAFKISIKNKEIIHADYLWQFLNSPIKIAMMQKLFNSAGQPHVGHKNIARLLVPLPPMKEQQKIAKILSTWDEAIEKLEQSIIKKQERKNGLLETLFEKTRSSSGSKKLEDLAEILPSNVDKKKEDGEKEVRLCNYVDVYKNNKINNSLEFMVASASEQEIQKFTIQNDDVIITKDSETAEDIAIPSYVAEEIKNLVCGYHLTLIRTNKSQLLGHFLYYYFLTARSKYYFYIMANGAIRFGLSVDAVKESNIPLPDLKTQRKIISVLNECEEEIEKMISMIQLLKMQKQGLMQQLLTGKKRVSV